MKPSSYDLATLKRDCEVIEIPSGRKSTLFAGTEAIITQSLGGTFTVMTHQGQMFSIAGKDADALGKEIPPEVKALEESKGKKSVEELVWEQLKTCYDPEIPHNIVDLGLIYECKIDPSPRPFPGRERGNAEEGFPLAPAGGEGQGEGVSVFIKMTLTAPGCGMGDWLRQDIRNKILGIPGVQECNVEVVFDPPWDRSKMHPALRRAFGY